MQAGPLCCHMFEKQNDVQFIRDMIAFMKQNFCVNEAAIFAAGISNGAYM